VKVKVWHEGMSDAETRDLAYWERNMLALYYADGWYNDDLEWTPESRTDAAKHGYVLGSTNVPRYDGWRRVLSLEDGKITFHIPDDFDVGNLPEILPNWDGHTTEEKWKRVLAARGIDA